ncbi:MAG: alpha/beta hydrolase [Cyanobacteria bacterium J06627_8]
MAKSFQSMACWIGGRFSSLLSLGTVVFASLSASVLFDATRVEAAERIVLTYGPFERYLVVDELQTLAETGEASTGIQFVANISGQEVSAIQNVFTQEVRLELGFLDRTLNSLPGEYALFQVGTVIHTPSRRANIQAIRAAFVLSASDDDYVSLLEVVENYPTQDVYLDGRQLLRNVRTVNNFVGGVEERLSPQIAIAQEILEGLICECESDGTAPDTAASDTDGSDTTPAE